MLDLETGHVRWTAADEIREVEEIYAQLQGGDGDAFEAALDAHGVPEWRRELLREAARIDASFGTRYQRIEPEDAHTAYRDMEAFIDTVGDVQLQCLLARAISGRGAFRSFRDVLQEYPAERERWFQFKSGWLRERALEWLREEGIEPVTEEPSG